MADPSSSTAAIKDSTSAAEPDTADLIEEELLVEEISIDGMCGVY